MRWPSVAVMAAQGLPVLKVGLMLIHLYSFRATVVVQLGATLLVLSRKLSWLGAGALIVFTALTIPLVHHFWNLQGGEHLNALHMATEHVALMAALAFVALTDLKRT